MSSDLSEKKIAIVCDWLTGIGGAERVVIELHKLFPNAPIYTSQYDSNKIDWFKDADVRTGWLQKIPRGLKKFIPVLRAWYFSHLDLSEFDLVISDTGAEAKAIKFGPNTQHICICNAPTHYYWSRYDQYMKEPGFGSFNWLARLGLKVLVGPMRKWDYAAAQKPTRIIAISSHIQKEIKKYYGRDAEIVFPPVELERFNLVTPQKKRSGFIITGRQTPYKRIDLAVKACTRLGESLTVVGNGPEHENLKTIAGPTIRFVTGASDKTVAELLTEARAFIFPGLDDFGIAPVEAMATGIPVIAYKAGGSLDYVVPSKTGEFFIKQTVDSLCEALRQFDHTKYSEETLKETAAHFSSQNFQNSIKQTLRS